MFSKTKRAKWNHWLAAGLPTARLGSSEAGFWRVIRVGGRLELGGERTARNVLARSMSPDGGRETPEAPLANKVMRHLAYSQHKTGATRNRGIWHTRSRKRLMSKKNNDALVSRVGYKTRCDGTGTEVRRQRYRVAILIEFRYLSDERNDNKLLDLCYILVLINHRFNFVSRKSESYINLYNYFIDKLFKITWFIYNSHFQKYSTSLYETVEIM